MVLPLGAAVPVQPESGCTSNDATALMLFADNPAFDAETDTFMELPVIDMPASEPLVSCPMDVMQKLYAAPVPSVTGCVCHAFGFWVESWNAGCITDTIAFPELRSAQAYPNTKLVLVKVPLGNPPGNLGMLAPVATERCKAFPSWLLVHERLAIVC